MPQLSEMGAGDLNDSGGQIDDSAIEDELNNLAAELGSTNVNSDSSKPANLNREPLLQNIVKVSRFALAYLHYVHFNLIFVNESMKCQNLLSGRRDPYCQQWANQNGSCALYSALLSLFSIEVLKKRDFRKTK